MENFTCDICGLLYSTKGCSKDKCNHIRSSGANDLELENSRLKENYRDNNEGNSFIIKGLHQEIKDLQTERKLLRETIKWQGGVDDSEPVVDDYLKYLKEV